LNIYEKIASIMGDIQYLAKDDRVEFNKTSYRALSEEKVTSIMRAELLKHKLIVYPVAQATNRAGTITHVDVTYRMVNVEDPKEYIEIASCGDGADTQDKGSGKAMTYAFKYMWLRTFALPTGEDPDKISSAELDAKQANIQPPGPPCADCGKEIMPYNDGKRAITAAEMAARSTEMFGRALCAKCSKAEGRRRADAGA
jgi:hypothetical protein